MITGKYLGKWPDFIQVTGSLPSGEPWYSNVAVSQEAVGLPLNAMFGKEHLDVLSAQAWMHNNDPALTQKVAGG